MTYKRKFAGYPAILTKDDPMYAKRLELMVELSKKGFNTVNIGKIFRLSDVTVALLFKNEGLDPKAVHHKYMFNKILHLLKGGMTIREIAKFIGVTRQDIDWYLKQNGLNHKEHKKQNYELAEIL